MHRPISLGHTPLILGAGPAGCAAAIMLARAGQRPLLLDRDELPGDPLCGGFLSWQTLAQLRVLGVDPLALGGHQVDTLRVFARGRTAELGLPAPACGLSRRALDSEMRRLAIANGAEFETDSISQLFPGSAQGRRRDWNCESIMLATGKHDLRGANRPRTGIDPALGLRLRLPASPAQIELLGSAIELHLFRGGYAGIVLQEGSSANICLALRKSALASAGNSRKALLTGLAQESPAFAARLGDDWRSARFDTIGSVPYGWIAQNSQPGLFRLGDQAAVIPSLAGEGIGIALASGQLAAKNWLSGGAAAAPAFQRELAQAAARPIRIAHAARQLAESVHGGTLIRMVAKHFPSLISLVAAATRIDSRVTLA